MQAKKINLPFDVWVATTAKKKLLFLFFESDCVIDQNKALETAGGSMFLRLFEKKVELMSNCLRCECQKLTFKLIE